MSTIKVVKAPAASPVSIGDVPAFDSAATEKVRWFSTQEHVASAVGWVILTDPRYASADWGQTVQNCINALPSTGGTVYVPPGTYTGAVRPVLKNSIVFKGAGLKASILSFTAGGFTWSTSLSGVHFEDIGITAAGGHTFEVTGSTGGLSQSKFHRCNLTSSGVGNSIWHQNNGGSFIDVEVSNSQLTHSGTATVPGWHVVSSAGSANQNIFRKLRVNGGNASAAPFFWIEETGSGHYAYDNHFEDITGEQDAGGLIWLLSGRNSIVSNCTDYDATTTYAGDVIKIGKSSTGPASYGCKVSRSGRRGGTLGAGLNDVLIESTSRNCVLELPSFSSTAVVVTAADDTVIISKGKVVGPNGLVTSAGITITGGTGSPAGLVVGSPGDLYLRTDGGAQVIYTKASGAATTDGWTTGAAAQVSVSRVNMGSALTGTTIDSVAIQALINASPSGAEFYFPRAGSGHILLNDGIAPKGPQTFRHEAGLQMQQTVIYKPCYDILDQDDVTIDNLWTVCTAASRGTTGIGGVRGSNQYTYAAGVWSNSNRTRVTGLTRVQNYAQGINFSAWDTASGAYISAGHYDNYIENLNVEGPNFALLYSGQVGLRVKNVTARSLIDDSAGVNPLHAIYASGSGTIRNKNVQIGNVICVDNPFGAAVQFKYTDGMFVESVIAENCGRLLNLIDVNDFDIGSIMLRTTRADADAQAIVSGQSPFPTRGKIRSVSINDTADCLTANSTSAFNFVGNQVEIDNITLTTNRATASTNYDLIFSGTDLTVRNVKIIANSSYAPAMVVGKSSAAATRVTVRGLETLNARRAIDIYGTSTGVLIENATQAHRTPGFVGSGISVVASTGTPDYQVLNVGGGSPFGLVSGESTIDRSVGLGDVTAPVSGQLVLRYFQAQKSETITQVKMCSGGTSAGSTPTLAKMGIYSVDVVSGDLTLVASTASDTTLFGTAYTAYTKTLSASFPKVAGRMYAVGALLVTASTMPSFIGTLFPAASVIDGLLGEGQRVSGSVLSQTDLPSTITAASVGNTRRQAYAELLP